MQSPPSLPITSQISLIAGDPGQSGPFTLRLKVLANMVLAPHTHAKFGERDRAVGRALPEVGEKLDESKGSLLTSGGFVSLPADMPHSLWTVKPVIIQVTGTGPFDLHHINPSDDPRNDKNDPRNKE